MAIAHSPSDALVVWTAADGNLFAERLSPSGMPLSTTLVTFGNDYLSDVAVAWNGSRYFVVWSNSVQLLGAFVATDGSSTPPRAFFNEPFFGQQPHRRSSQWPRISLGTASTSSSCLVNGELRLQRPLPGTNPDQFRVMRRIGGWRSHRQLAARNHRQSSPRARGLERCGVVDHAGRPQRGVHDRRAQPRAASRSMRRLRFSGGL